MSKKNKGKKIQATAQDELIKPKQKQGKKS
jgi:hypothetical protein